MRPADRESKGTVEKAWEALERDEPESALALLKRASDKSAERFVAEAAARLALDDLPGARRAMDRADELDLPFEDVEGLWTRAELLLREWRIAEAEAIFETLERLDRNAEVLDRLAFCADMRHDRARADRFEKECEKLDAEGYPRPPQLKERAFWAEIDAAVTELPEPFQRVLDECRIEVLPVPTIEIAKRGDLAELPPDTLGLFSGPSLLERDGGGHAELPPVIYLFQRNLERVARDEGDLVEEIRVTLYHELGHLLGFDEEGVDRMGLQ